MDRSFEITANGANVLRPFEDDFSDLRGVRVGIDIGGQTQIIDVIPGGGPYEFAEDFAEALFEAFEALPALIDAPDFVVNTVAGIPVSVGDVIPLPDGGTLSVNQDGVIFDPGTAYDGLMTGDVISFGVDFAVQDGSGDVSILGLGVEAVGNDVLPTQFDLTGDALINTPEELVVNVRGSDGNITTGGQAGDSLIIDFLTFDVVSVEPILAENATGSFAVTEVPAPPENDQPQQFAVLAFGGGGRDATEDQLGFVTAGRDLEPGFSRRPSDGPDKLRGTGSGDTIDLLAGDDTVFGDNGRDTLFGGFGNDEINGGSDDDRIDGGPGDDLLAGELGTDTYIFTGTFGNDRIDDRGRMDLDFDANAVRSFARAIDDLVITATGGEVIIEDYYRTGSEATVREGGAARLINLTPVSISVSDASISERAVVGDVVARVVVFDDDDNSHTLRLSGPGAEDFSVSGSNIRVARTLDFETVPEYRITVTATDPAGNSLASPLTITIEDEDEGGEGGNGGDGQLGQGLSPEEARTVALLYEAGLDRDGNIDLPGLNFWIDQRENGLSPENLSQAFLQSPEFEAAFGEATDASDPNYLSDVELVQQLYRNVLNREGDVAGVTFWASLPSDQGFSRADLLLAFAISVENTEDSAFINSLTETSPGEWAFLG